MSTSIPQQGSARNARGGSCLLANLPVKLRRHRQFVVWRYEDHGGPKPAKVPYNPLTGKRASVSNPATWATLDEALAAYNAEDYDGIGFVFTQDDPFGGIDLDKCRDPETGEVQPWAREIMRRVGGYWETSPSGTGLHSIAEMSAPLPKHGRKKGHVEIYETARFFTLTGLHVEGTATDITDCTQAVLSLHASVFGDPEQPSDKVSESPVVNLSDERLLRIASKAKNGAKFTALWKGDMSGYPSHSEADLALCSLLAFYCGNDPERINRLFMQSGLYREKWDREDYSSDTINAALLSVQTFYGNPEKPKTSEAVRAMSECIAFFPWRGVAATSARLVLTALMQLMNEAGKDEIAADCRTIGEMTGLGFATVAAALRRLSGVPKDRRDNIPVCLVRVVDKRVTNNDGKASRHAYRYRLIESAIPAQSNNTVPPCVSECVSFAPCLKTTSHDAFRCRGRGLTRSAALVLASLPCRTAKEIAAKTCLSRRTVRTALASLQAENLVEKNEKIGEWTRTCETLDAVAKRRGTVGYGEKQRKLHKLQRESFNAWLVRPRGRNAGNPYVLRKEEQQPPDCVWWENIEWRDAA